MFILNILTNSHGLHRSCDMLVAKSEDRVKQSKYSEQTSQSYKNINKGNNVKYYIPRKLNINPFKGSLIWYFTCFSYVDGLSELVVHTGEELAHLYEQGNRARKIGMMGDVGAHRSRYGAWRLFPPFCQRFIEICVVFPEMLMNVVKYA